VKTGPSLWYKDAIIYEVHVRAFYDSNADGIGDFPGLIEKLDYIQELGVTAVWLLPFYPSPLRDDGYDIADYFDVHPAYGTLRDFKRFLREAHRRGLRVITELVLNHTSDQHPWFQRARRARPGSRWRNFYVWSDTPDRYKEARVIFKDYEPSNWAWDPVARAYYWHRFFSHQPDLNYDNPEVRKAVFRVLDFWPELGVDGFRLDAVPYLFEREGTSCENLPETHAFLKELRRHVDERFGERMLLAEANQWPEDAVAYFGDGDECHMAFHFPLMPRLFMAIHMEDRFPIVDILNQTPPIPEGCQWALFLRNHDELTLEMVTDEERDYMYRVYARDRHARVNLGIRRRLAPLLNNNRRRIELMNGLLFSLPGTPVIYYGDEIGMGDNFFLGDRNAVRTPMQWSADRNAGFSRANPQRLYLPVITDPEYHYEAVNVEAQQQNPQSLLWWMRRLIALRKQFRAFGRGSLRFLNPENRKVLAFVREWRQPDGREERVLVVANLSRFAQYAELDLSAFKGLVPVEVFGRTEFPPIGDGRYPVMLGPHSFYWFALEPARVELRLPNRETGRAVTVGGDWTAVFADGRAALEGLLPSYLEGRRWFGAKARQVRAVRLVDAVPFPYGQRTACLALFQVYFTEGQPETYLLPLAFGPAETVAEEAVVARLRVERERGGRAEGVLFDALADPEFLKALPEAVGRRRRYRGLAGEVAAEPTHAFGQLRRSGRSPTPVSLGRDQTNSSVFYGDLFVLKLYRRLEEGRSPEFELGTYLTEHARFGAVPPLAGAIEYRPESGEPVTLAVLQGYVPNHGDAWQYTLGFLDHYFEEALAAGGEVSVPPFSVGRLVGVAGEPVPEAAQRLMGSYLDSAWVLGRRTAELHLALAAAGPELAEFVPEPFTPFHQRAAYQSFRNLTNQVLDLLRKRSGTLTAEAGALAAEVLARERPILELFGRFRDGRLTVGRIRAHGDYHLGQVLYTGNDFVIADFEGEPARGLRERRLKQPALRDVAGMLRSFHYAAEVALRQAAARGLGSVSALRHWAGFWELWASAAFLRGYLETETARSPVVVPESRDELGLLLSVYLLEKAVYELGYELNNRPDWVEIPLRGILKLVP
jgi:maltose alpha-D-glucosyltransferase/alpha-amylase